MLRIALYEAHQPTTSETDQEDQGWCQSPN